MPRGDARRAAEWAAQAEAAGWDAFFVWDPVWGIDPWVALAAAAMVTGRIRLGTMLTPVSRRRPWTLAGQTATLDNLSNGRLILAVGLGATDTGFFEFGEETDRKTRAELMDEGLETITGLWRGQPFNFTGKHYTVRETTFILPPPPVQQPRIPVWMVGAWPFEKSMQRAARWDGLLPNVMDPQTRQHGPTTHEALRAMSDWIAGHRESEGDYDIVMEGVTPGDEPAKASEIVRGWQQAGATWWIEGMWDEPDMDLVLRRLKQGPPQI